MKFRKKPVFVDAYQTDKEMDIETLEGTMHADKGDGIITGVHGEKYPCKPDIFKKTYEAIDGGFDKKFNRMYDNKNKPHYYDCECCRNKGDCRPEHNDMAESCSNYDYSNLPEGLEDEENKNERR